MAFSYWARVTSLCAFAILSTLSIGQAFGRFGYAAIPKVACFDINPKGFKVQNPKADSLYFEEPLPGLRPVVTSNLSQTLYIGGMRRSPSKLKVDLTAPGFMMFFEAGAKFRLTTTGSPFLTWKEGSVGSDVPTPKLPYVLLSFKDAQPPITLGAVGDSCGWVIKGRPGDWSLETAELYHGWIRVAAPMGMKGFSTNTASELGEVAATAEKHAAIWSQPSPQLVSVDVDAEATNIVAKWIFDRPGAILPQSISLAPIGKYNLALLSKAESLEAPCIEGPISVATGNEIAARFPARAIPAGRSLCEGRPVDEPVASASGDDIRGVCELALNALLAGRDSETAKSCRAAFDDYFGNSPVMIEPSTGQRLPYSADGTGIDGCAAYALLWSAINAASSAEPQANALLTSIDWRMDWSSWSLGDDPRSRRAAAIAAVAAAMTQDSTARLHGAMLEAGLAAQRGLAVWKAHRSMENNAGATFVEALPDIRSYLYGWDVAKTSNRLLSSSVRFFGEGSFRFESVKLGKALVWSAPGKIFQTAIVAGRAPLSVVSSQNVEEVSATSLFNLTFVRWTTAGAGRCQIVFEGDFGDVPSIQKVPTYSEILR